MKDMLIGAEIDRATLAVNNAYHTGYNQGLAMAVQRLRMIAAIIPESVTKADLIRMAGNEAEYLTGKMIRQEA